MSAMTRRRWLSTIAVTVLGTTAQAGDRSPPPSRSDRSGLGAVGEPEPGKIPVVFVHGLWGRPAIWEAMIQGLEADPELRDRFQFWTFGYPTGEPILDSAADLAEALRRARAERDPLGIDPAFDRVVLVGHSMGGLLAKAVATRPLPGVPTIGRIVFIATPHRGSPLADGLAGKIGARFLKPDDFDPRRQGSRPRSIEQLATGHSLLPQLDAAGALRTIPHHSILAELDPGRRRTDGVVPSASAHLDGAESERVVPGGHMCQDHPEAIREVARILHLHAKSSARPRGNLEVRGKTGIAPGVPPSSREAR